MAENAKDIWGEAGSIAAKFLGEAKAGEPVSADTSERLIALTSTCCLLWEIIVGPGAKDLELIKNAAQTLRRQMDRVRVSIQ